MNVYNTKDIKHFDELHSKWWDKNGPLKTLHAINPLRLRYIQNNCSIKNKLVLDIGCGGGILSSSMAKKGAKVVGIDPSKKLIKIASINALKHKDNVKYLNVTLEEYVKSVGNKFDVITCMELIEHVKNPIQFIKILKPLLKKETLIFFSTINRNVISYFKAIFFAEYILNIIPRGTHNFKNFIKPNELNSMLLNVNFSLTNIQGFQYNPLTNNAKFCTNIDCNYMSCFKFSK